MNRRRTAILGIVAFVCGAVSFFNARSAALSNEELEQNTSQQLLSNASDDAVALECEFNQEMTGLVANLMGRQQSLGSALEDPCTPDEAILEHAENVVEARESLMRHAGEHVVELRGRLPADNRQHLMGLCAETVRGPICRMDGRGGGRGMGLGYGRRGGRPGAGGGYGMHRRVCNRLANCLMLDEGQVSLLHEKDPDFETATADLRNVLLAERATLLSVFEDPKSKDDQLLQQIERLITAQSRIERRIARHVLVLRPYLTVEQQRRLIGLCRRSQDISQLASDPQ
jgi:hypothetical protein